MIAATAALVSSGEKGAYSLQSMIYGSMAINIIT